MTPPVTPSVTPSVRPRREADLPTLVHLLAEQQAGSGYPARWPLPFAPERFLVRPGERAAWVAERDGALLGHVAVADLDETDAELARHFAPALAGRPAGMVSVLFTALAARGTGVGGLLLDTAVAAVREEGRVPVLDVLPTHAPALALYRRRGWVEVGAVRLGWMAPHHPDVVLMVLPD